MIYLDCPHSGSEKKPRFTWHANYYLVDPGCGGHTVLAWEKMLVKKVIISVGDMIYKFVHSGNEVARS